MNTRISPLRYVLAAAISLLLAPRALAADPHTTAPAPSSGSLLAAFDPSINPSLPHSAGPSAASPAEFLAADPLQITLTAGVWFPRLRGTSSLENSAGDSDDVDFRTGFFLRERRFIPLLEASILKNQTWQIDLTAFWTAADNTGIFDADANTVFGSLTFNDGDPYSVSVDINSAAAQLSYWGFKPMSLSNECRANLWFSPIFILRYVNIQQTVRDAAARFESQDNDFFSLMLGPQLHFSWACDHHIPFLRSLDIDGLIAAGPAFGNDAGSAWQLRAAATAHFSCALSASFGFRLLELDVPADNYRFSAGLQGLFLSASWRF